VCVCERERERVCKRERVCVCVCVCVSLCVCGLFHVSNSQVTYLYFIKISPYALKTQIKTEALIGFSTVSETLQRFCCHLDYLITFLKKMLAEKKGLQEGLLYIRHPSSIAVDHCLQCSFSDIMALFGSKETT
jgi:hypothetical protein